MPKMTYLLGGKVCLAYLYTFHGASKTLGTFISYLFEKIKGIYWTS